jgi:hypothetical protein
MPPDLQALSFQTGSIFTPGAPINEKDLFAGRSEQVEKIIVIFSQGVPYIAHLLCIFTCRAALASGRKTVYASHVELRMSRSLDQWQQSIEALYDEAVQSP